VKLGGVDDHRDLLSMPGDDLGTVRSRTPQHLAESLLGLLDLPLRVMWLGTHI
jgi:hypothetical protein